MYQPDMSNQMDGLSVELVECIVGFLDYEGISNLRLTGRQLFWKASQGRFRNWLTTKCVDLSPGALQKFVSMTKKGGPGCLIQHLVLRGVVYNKGDSSNDETDDDSEDSEDSREERDAYSHPRDQLLQFDDSGKAVALLANAFQNIAENMEKKVLSSISLDITVLDSTGSRRLSTSEGTSWRSIWESAARAFEIFLDSIRDCPLQFERLVLFDIPRCSIACTELKHKNLLRQCSHRLENTRSLFLSFSEKDVDFTYWKGDEFGDDIDIEAVEDDDHQVHPESNFDNLILMLKNLPRLEVLQLHRCKLLVGYARVYSERLLRRLTKGLTFANLREFELANVDADGSDVLKFLKSSPINKVSLQRIALTSGSWIPIFDYCTSADAGMDHLVFDTLFEPTFSHDPYHCRPPKRCSKTSPGSACLYRAGLRFNALTGPPEPESDDATSRMEVKGFQVRQPIRYHVLPPPYNGPATPLHPRYKKKPRDDVWGPPY